MVGSVLATYANRRRTDMAFGHTAACAEPSMRRFLTLGWIPPGHVRTTSQQANPRKHGEQESTRVQGKMSTVPRRWSLAQVLSLSYVLPYIASCILFFHLRPLRNVRTLLPRATAITITSRVCIFLSISFLLLSYRDFPLTPVAIANTCCNSLSVSIPLDDPAASPLQANIESPQYTYSYKWKARDENRVGKPIGIHMPESSRALSAGSPDIFRNKFTPFFLSAFAPADSPRGVAKEPFALPDNIFSAPTSSPRIRDSPGNQALSVPPRWVYPPKPTETPAPNTRSSLTPRTVVVHFSRPSFSFSAPRAVHTYLTW